LFFIDLLEVKSMKLCKLLLAMTAVAFALAGCSRSDPVPPPVNNDFTPIDSGNASTTGFVETPAGRFQPFPGMQPGDLEQLNNNLIVYFEYDSSEIRSDFNAMLAAHGRYLASDSGIVIRLEGHADERGSREYNIGLGERRAQAVRQILMLQGASASQLATVSYGEERPAVFGSDDEAYSLNRRVELVYP
jgi:peptidoglycan-associated lipoprotein